MYVERQSLSPVRGATSLLLLVRVEETDLPKDMRALSLALVVPLRLNGDRNFRV